MKHLIIGFCAAGANAAEALRKADPDAEVTVLNGDSRFFYLRLDLEGVFEGKPLERIQPRPPEFWAAKNIRVENDRAVRVDPVRKEVHTQTGRVFPYDKLLIATGANPRRLNIPGEDLPGVFTYHSLEDAQRIFAQQPHVRHATIIGGGILGLEFARVAHETFHWELTLLIRGGFAGSGMVDEAGGMYVLRALQAAGVDVRLHEEAAKIEQDNGKLSRVVTKSGHIINTDFVARCVGIEAAADFLKETGALTGGKLIVNEMLETPVRDIFAAGDVTIVQLPDGRRVHCNTWNVAMDQARAAAANMLGKQTAWKEDVLYNLDALFTLPLAVIGQWEFRHQPGYVIHDLSTEQAHRQVVTRDGILVAAVLLGDRTGDRRIRKLIAQNARVLDKLARIFDPEAKPEEFVNP